ncbi:MAG TPA: hypothetical protein VK762_09460 [Polyangiaceae bacterium]|nr:hypothetical protein [Polyangiaceae bacterium]
MSASPLDTLWYAHGSAPTAVGLAAQLGWFERVFGPDGIAVRSVHDSDDHAAREAQFDRERGHSFHQTGSVAPIWARAEGRDNARHPRFLEPREALLRALGVTAAEPRDATPTAAS